MFSHSLASPSNPKPSTAGFSLVELLVSIGIIVLVLSIVVTRQSAFNSAVLLRSQAYEIALAVREVQLSAVSAQSDGLGEFRNVTGVHFDESNPDRFVIFADGTNSGAADDFFSAVETRGAPGLLDSRFGITDIFYNSGDISEVSVTFERPNFDARFKTSSGGTLETTGLIELHLRPDGVTSGTECGELRIIQITATGQVTVLEC